MTKHKKRMSNKELEVFGKLCPFKFSKNSLVKVLDRRYKKGFYMAQVHEQIKVNGKSEIFITKWGRRKLKWVYGWVLGWRVFPEDVDLESI